MTDLTPRCQDADDLDCEQLAELDQAERDREAHRWHGCDQGHAWFAGVCGWCGALRGLPYPRAG